MKQRFNNLDLRAALFELREAFLGCRVANIYDVDHKTYLIKLTKPDSKAVILIESGIRIHGTSFDWPKNLIPSGFSMKMRKHLRSRRLEQINQLGADRIVDLQFGSNEAAYHLIVELYDRGNILLTDHEYTIISVLRPRTDADADVKFTVREKYPLELAKQYESMTIEKLKEIFASRNNETDVKRLLITHTTFGAPLIDHCLTIGGFPDKCVIGKTFEVDRDLENLLKALNEADTVMLNASTKQSKGYVTQKKTKALKIVGASTVEEEVLNYEEFHPILFKKHESQPFIEFDSFDKAVDEFYSKLESQKLDQKVQQQTKEAVKKLENVKKDHQRRLEELKISQTEDEMKANLIEYNLELVDSAIFIVNNAVANQLDWNEINDIIQEAKNEGHKVARAIKQLKLEMNHIVLALNNFEESDDEESGDDEGEKTKLSKRPVFVDIDLALNAYKNSRKYYDKKKSLIVKEQKTIDASGKALKSAEKKTIEILKQSKKVKTITKARKTYWFEKFYWFISSENYLVIGGRDSQQNELIVKRYMKAGDVYVHADIHGASSIVIKNPKGPQSPVPPKTLNEAGLMAICYSTAWEAKVLVNAYWVFDHQVSKQAPTGEYLGTGSFMIRGKKNFLPQTALVFGFGVLYKLDDGSLARHKDERCVKTLEEEDHELEKYRVEEAAEEEVQPLEEEPEEKDSEATEFPDTSFKMRLVSETETPKVEEAAKAAAESSSGESSDESAAGSDEEDNDEENEGDEPAKETPAPSASTEKTDEHETPSTTSGKSAPAGKGKKQPKASAAAAAAVTKKEPQQDSKKEADKSNKQQPLKRGQKARLNKMKSKYKDQDDEDRELVMQFLAPAGKNEKKLQQERERQEKHERKEQNQQRQKQKQQMKEQKPVKPAANLHVASASADPADPAEPGLPAAQAAAEPENMEFDDELLANQDDEVDVIDSLTGMPHEEDELLFCVTVCAPYSSIQNYKHKVKLNPGTTKKGQAVKTALEIFSRDKATTANERDLIKLLKDQDLSRNLPGKVKVSAPNLMRIKRK